MNYIVMDLEWNQCPIGEEEREGLPFEIVEIGAVKLNGERELLDTFHALIRPTAYKNIHPKTNEIIHLDIKELEGGAFFPEAAECFLSWCGEDCRFCTWGTSDLTEFQRNMEYYHMKPLADRPFIFYDVQKLFSIYTEGKKNPRTLEYAVDYWRIEKSSGFHRAIWDAEYTAEVFRKISREVMESYYSIDYYHNPKTKEDEVYVFYKNYSKQITCEYPTKEEMMEDKDLTGILCCKCQKPAARKIKWFSSNMKNYVCLACCQEHGYLKGRMRVYKTRGKKYFAIKIVKLIPEENAWFLKERYNRVKEKKKEKRKLDKH